MWWAEWQFRLGKRLPEGGTLRDAFAAYRKQFRTAHPEDRAPTHPPRAIFHLWAWYQEIAQGRPVGGMGVLLPIPAMEIAAWAALRRVALEDWELDCIRALDAAFLRVMAEEV